MTTKLKNKLLNDKTDFETGKITREDFYLKVINFLINNPSESALGLSKHLNIPKRTFNENLARLNFNGATRQQMAGMSVAERNELMSNIRQNQKTKDKLNVYRKNTRQKNRLINGVEEYSEKLLKVVKSKQLSKLTVKHPTSTSKAAGIIHFSDLHINEQINLSNNVFNIQIASERIQKHVDNARRMFKAYGITDVVIAFTGDLMNSNRRMDELLLNATNRANATFVAVDILQQAILDLNQDFNVTCANVTGNESRIDKDLGWINDLAQDNFDFMIYNMLAYMFKDSDGVKFLRPDDTYNEKVVDVMGRKVLLLHGHNGFARDTDSKIAAKMGQYAQKGIIVDYVLMGHIHSAHISDLFARSSGLPGANNYSQNALNLTGKASQNIYIINDDGDIHGMKVDLQNTDKYSGYNIKRLDIYDEF